MKEVQLQVIEKNQSRTYKILLLLFFTSTLLMFMSIILKANNLLYFSTSCVMFFGILVSFTKSYSIFGYILFNEDGVTLISKSTKEKIPVKTISKIVIVLEEYEGEPFRFNPRSISSKEGTNNFIMIVTTEKKYMIEVLMKKMTATRLKPILNRWISTNNTQVEVKSKRGHKRSLT